MKSLAPMVWGFFVGVWFGVGGLIAGLSMFVPNICRVIGAAVWPFW